MNRRSLLTGAFFLAIAFSQFWKEGLSGMTLLLAGVAFVVFILGFMGLELPKVTQVTGTANFMSDPGGSIVDAATKRAKQWVAGDDKVKQAILNPTDTLSRYLEVRPDVAAVENLIAVPPEFGRKGTTPEDPSSNPPPSG